MQYAIQLLLLVGVAAASALAARRFNHRLAGMLLGMPWISGPLSLWLALRIGPEATAKLALAAVGSMVGAALLFSVYRMLIERVPWWLAPGGSGAAWWAVGASMLDTTLSLLAIGSAAAAALAAALLFVPCGCVRSAARQSVARDIGLRAVAVTLLFGVVSVAGARISPQLSGLLLAFPLLSTASVALVHRSEGRCAAAAALGGALRGQVAMLAFFLVVASTATVAPLAVTYGAAIFAAALASGLLMRLDRWRERDGQRAADIAVR